MKENEMVFGIRAVIEAIQADKEVDKILVKRDLQGDLSKELFEVLRGREIPVQRVPAERLDRLTRKNHQGVIAFMSAVTYQSLEDRPARRGGERRCDVQGDYGGRRLR